MDFKKIKFDFPIFEQRIHGNPLTYLDSAASSQKPRQVIERMNQFYTHEYASIYRGVYHLAEKATLAFENVREQVATFIDANSNEIIFTRGATASINFIATAWARETLKVDDEIVISELEHHANLIPWQQVARKTGAKLTYIRITDDGDLDYNQIDTVISKNTKIVAITACSNAIGTHVNLTPIISRARLVGAKILVDGSQLAAHRKISMKELDVDFFVFSAHKMLGPTGLGVLYVNKKMHEELEPYQFGGSMVYDVSWQNATWRPAPLKYEAGTPPIAEVIGFGQAIAYLNDHVNFTLLKKHEASLTSQFIDAFESYERMRFLGPLKKLKEDGHLISFTVEGIHPHDIAAYLDQSGICVRAGNHCARPLHVKLGIDTSVRVSFYLYNSESDVEHLIANMKRLL